MPSLHEKVKRFYQANSNLTSAQLSASAILGPKLLMGSTIAKAVEHKKEVNNSLEQKATPNHAESIDNIEVLCYIASEYVIEGAKEAKNSDLFTTQYPFCTTIRQLSEAKNETDFFKQLSGLLATLENKNNLNQFLEFLQVIASLCPAKLEAACPSLFRQLNLLPYAISTLEPEIAKLIKHFKQTKFSPEFNLITLALSGAIANAPIQKFNILILETIVNSLNSLNHPQNMINFSTEHAKCWQATFSGLSTQQQGSLAAGFIKKLIAVNYVDTTKTEILNLLLQKLPRTKEFTSLRIDVVAFFLAIVKKTKDDILTIIDTVSIVISAVESMTLEELNGELSTILLNISPLLKKMLKAFDNTHADEGVKNILTLGRFVKELPELKAHTETRKQIAQAILTQVNHPIFKISQAAVNVSIDIFKEFDLPTQINIIKTALNNLIQLGNTQNFVIYAQTVATMATGIPISERIELFNQIPLVKNLLDRFDTCVQNSNDVALKRVIEALDALFPTLSNATQQDILAQMIHRLALQKAQAIAAAELLAKLFNHFPVEFNNQKITVIEMMTKKLTLLDQRDVMVEKMGDILAVLPNTTKELHAVKLNNLSALCAAFSYRPEILSPFLIRALDKITYCLPDHLSSMRIDVIKLFVLAFEADLSWDIKAALMQAFGKPLMQLSDSSVQINVIEQLVRHLKDSNEAVRSAAIQSLCNIIPFLPDSMIIQLTKQDTKTNGLLNQAIELLIQQLSSTDNNVRVTDYQRVAAQALGAIIPCLPNTDCCNELKDQTINALMPEIEDDDIAYKETVANALSLCIASLPKNFRWQKMSQVVEKLLYQFNSCSRTDPFGNYELAPNSEAAFKALISMITPLCESHKNQFIYGILSRYLDNPSFIKTNDEVAHLYIVRVISEISNNRRTQLEIGHQLKEACHLPEPLAELIGQFSL